MMKRLFFLVVLILMNSPLLIAQKFSRGEYCFPNSRIFTSYEVLSRQINPDSVDILLLGGEESYSPQEEDINQNLLLSLGKYRNLRELIFTRLGIDSFPKEISTLTRLECLSFKNVKFSPLIVDIALPPNLKHLAVENSNFNPVWFEKSNLIYSLVDLKYEPQDSSLDFRIFKLVNLQVLNVSNSSVSKIPKEIGNLKSLEELNLSFTEISDLPKSISDLKKMKILDLRRTKMRVLPNELFKIKKLKLFLTGDKSNPYKYFSSTYIESLMKGHPKGWEIYLD